MGTPNEPGPAPKVGGAEPPTAATVLGWIAAAGGQPWFPSQHAAATGVNRDALDEPLGQLRLAGLVRIATWVRGLGQGYVLTDAGQAALARRAPLVLPDTRRPVAPVTNASEPVSPTELDKPLVAVSDYRPVALPAFDPRPAVVVPVLVILNLLWFSAGVVLALWDGLPVWDYLSGRNVELLHRLGGVTGFDLLIGQWWRLFTSCFVHAGGGHLAVNLIALGIVGPQVELLWGRARVLVIYLFSGLAGSCLAMALRPEAVLIGASGAIWGVLMALLMWVLLFRHHLGPKAAGDATRRLVFAIVLNAGFSLLPGISWEGHLGGGVAGFVTAGLLYVRRFGDRTRRLAALVALLGVPVLCVGGLLLAMDYGKPWIAFKQKLTDERERLAAATEKFARDQRTQQIVSAYFVAVNQLSPAHVEPVEKRAVAQLLRPGPKRNAEVAAEVRARLTELKAAADTVAAQLAGPPAGVSGLDQVQEQVKRFADARARSFTLLLDMLATDTVPDQKAWDEWGKARHTASESWKGVRNQ